MNCTFFRRITLFLLIACSVTNVYCHKKDSLHVTHLEFIANQGQWEQQILYKARLNGGVLFAEADRITFVLLNQEQLSRFYDAKLNPTLNADRFIDAAAYQMVFKGSNPDAKISGLKQAFHHHNYFVGKDPSRWASKVPLYQELEYQNIYEGIDLLFHQQRHQLKYEFRVSEGADPRKIQIEYAGANSLTLNNGHLIIKTDVGQIMELAPFAYQLDNQGQIVTIPCKFLLQKNTISYQLDNYNQKKILIIDPEVIFSSYSGSTVDNWGFTATYDQHGNLYGGGIAFGIGYPTQVGHHYQVDYAGGACDVAISKFDSSGSQLYYSTYLGGASAECPHSMFVNDNDELYVFGTTGSPNFPFTSQAYDTTYNGGSAINVNNISFPHGTDIFISKFSAGGDHLLASTFIGGSNNDGLNSGGPLRKNYADEFRGEIIVDGQSNVYVVSCTFSSNFPVTPGSFQTTHKGGKEGCVIKMDQSLSHLIWSSFIGGSGEDACYSMDLANDHSIYLCGGTTTSQLPVSPSAVQATYGGGICDGFVAHISENGDQLLHCTYLGKADYDQSYLLKLNRHNHPYIFGQTKAAGHSWFVNTLDGTPGGGQFLTHLAPALDSIIWSTAYGVGGGQGPDVSPTALLVDLCNTVYMSGWGSRQLNGFGGTMGLPITNNAFQTSTDGSDYYFICLQEEGTSLVYATYFGSPNAREHVDGGTSRFDKKGIIYQAICAGCGGFDNFPTTPGAWSETNESDNCNLGVVKMDFKLPLIIADFNAPLMVCFPDTVFFRNNSQTQSPMTQFQWDFGDGSTSTESNPAHQYTHGGLYHVTLSVHDDRSCNLQDSISKDILVLTGGTQQLPNLKICRGEFVQIGIAPSSGPDIHYQWAPENTLSNPLISNPIATPDNTTTYRLIISTPSCSDTIYQTVDVEDLQISDLTDTTICLGDSITLQFLLLTGTPTHIVWSLHSDYSAPVAEGQQHLLIHPTEETHYFLKVEGSQCSIQKKVIVAVSSVHIDKPAPVRICFEDSLQLSVHASGGDELHYQWRPTSEISSGHDSAQPWIHPSQSVNYTVTVTNEHGCNATDTIPVTKRTGTFHNGLEAWCEPCFIIEGETAQLYSTVYDTFYHYSWTPSPHLSSPHQAETGASPTETTSYTLIVTDSFGCVMSKEVTVEVQPFICDEPLVFVPNTFTPNDDTKNDILYVRSGILKEFTFRIYNRWGELIFESDSPDKGWDGCHKGKKCEQGVYDYYLTGTCVNGEKIIKKGNITLLF
ncbi:MAG: gliding motility-associated C-terminal domain-containing protein [Bacteroidales bacterium]|nr:gliding motility-associated C-terminal domain-containing protein [Bacteroidales bacterium]